MHREYISHKQHLKNHIPHSCGPPTEYTHVLLVVNVKKASEPVGWRFWKQIHLQIGFGDNIFYKILSLYILPHCQSLDKLLLRIIPDSEWEETGEPLVPSFICTGDGTPRRCYLHQP